MGHFITSGNVVSCSFLLQGPTLALTLMLFLIVSTLPVLCHSQCLLKLTCFALTFELCGFEVFERTSWLDTTSHRWDETGGKQLEGISVVGCSFHSYPHLCLLCRKTRPPLWAPLRSAKRKMRGGQLVPWLRLLGNNFNVSLCIVFFFYLNHFYLTSFDILTPPLYLWQHHLKHFPSCLPMYPLHLLHFTFSLSNSFLLLSVS